MRQIPLVLAAVGTFSVLGCNPFRSPLKQDPVVEVTRRDANVNARWHGTLASPSSLAGAVQMKGSVAMSPGSTSGNTRVTIELSNASPGGLHPWQLHRGQCGMDDGVFGSASGYKSLKVDDEGKASDAVTLPMAMPVEGRFYVSVGASAANPETIVACGNLAPPTQ